MDNLNSTVNTADESADKPRREKDALGTECYTVIASPLGEILLGSNGEALTLINFQQGDGAMKSRPAWRKARDPFSAAVLQLKAYFAGELKQFDLPLAPRGTDFQLKVWAALREIPYGETRSYGQLALQLGMPTGSRAVGAANGRNPLPIVVPCHRVIGADGSLTGFYGGLRLKQELLGLEQQHCPGGQLSLL